MTSCVAGPACDSKRDEDLIPVSVHNEPKNLCEFVARENEHSRARNQFAHGRVK